MEALNLWQRMATVAIKATESGHLKTMSSRIETIETNGVKFIVRLASELSTKQKYFDRPESNTPFLPPEPELVVESMGPEHSLILNKYNVLPLHGLITTKQYVAQTDLLRLSDFNALSLALNQVDGFIFYNGGKPAGASQQHRHFQLVPKDLGAGLLPIDEGIYRLQCDGNCKLFPFQYRMAMLANWQCETLFDAWKKMEYSWQPYNLLITRDWMLVIPRLTALAGPISINSLGFAGALLAKNKAELDFIHQHGPMKVLSMVCPK